MNGFPRLSLNRIILYVQDVQRLTDFYRDILGLSIVESIPEEWTVFQAGECQLALHCVGKPYRVADTASWRVHSNAKLVMTVRSELEPLRERLIAAGVPMGEIKAYPGFSGPLCDGTDPEGNVFQLAQK